MGPYDSHFIFLEIAPSQPQQRTSSRVLKPSTLCYSVKWYEKEVILSRIESTPVQTVILS